MNKVRKVFVMKKTTTVIVNGKKESNTRTKLIVVTLLVLVLIGMIMYTITRFITSNKFAESINEFWKLNANTIFSIDNIYMYSSADADNNAEDRAIWNLNVHQYTDIAIYINNRSEEKLDYGNSIKEMYIDNVKFSNLKNGTPSLAFKDIQDFGKFTDVEENIINDKIEYKILNDGDIDYSKPQMYADCSNPIILEYANKNIKENEIISDIDTDLIFNGELLRRTGVFLDDIKCTVSFNINIINNYEQKFIANVYLNIPLEDTQTGETIYNGKKIKKIQTPNYIKFFRIV